MIELFFGSSLMMLCRKRYSPTDLFSKSFYNSLIMFFHVYLSFLFFRDLYVHNHKGLFLYPYYYQTPKIYSQITIKLVYYLRFNMRWLVVTDIPNYGTLFYLYYCFGHSAIMKINQVSLFLNYLYVESTPLQFRLNSPIYVPQDT